MRAVVEESAGGARECFALAESYFAQNRIERAQSLYDAALKLGMHPECGAYERWACAMMLGDFERAWQETDRTEAIRKASGQGDGHLPLHFRRVWDGIPLAGRDVMVRCYHGLGDTIQFIRYLRPLKQVARFVTVECQERLIPMVRDSFPEAARLVPMHHSGGSRFDVEIELMELPYAFRTTLETIPSEMPYVRVPDSSVEQRKAELRRFGLAEDALNVGLVWSSGAWNRSRDIVLDQTCLLGEIPGIKLFSLQRDAAGLMSGRSSIIPIEAESGTVLDTAAAIQNLDLVISVDTMVAHLAGAVSKPVWLLLPFHADWRWMTERQDSPWYPTMRIFRQTKPGQWSQVVEKVKDELQRAQSEGIKARALTKAAAG